MKIPLVSVLLYQVISLWFLFKSPIFCILWVFSQFIKCLNVVVAVVSQSCRLSSCSPESWTTTTSRSSEKNELNVSSETTKSCLVIAFINVWETPLAKYRLVSNHSLTMQIKLDERMLNNVDDEKSTIHLLSFLFLLFFSPELYCCWYFTH